MRESVDGQLLHKTVDPATGRTPGERGEIRPVFRLLTLYYAGGSIYFRAMREGR
jgi:hypothetical protein